jgi:hypothetical protein
MKEKERENPWKSILAFGEAVVKILKSQEIHSRG